MLVALGGISALFDIEFIVEFTGKNMPYFADATVV